MVAAKKKGAKNGQKKKTGDLEKLYRQYLTPLPQDAWAQVTDLSQPSMLKSVPTKTSYYYAD